MGVRREARAAVPLDNDKKTKNSGEAATILSLSSATSGSAKPLIRAIQLRITNS